MKYCLFLLILVMAPLWAGEAPEEKQELPIRHHPVKLPIPEGMRVPDELRPDDKGLIICSTCHGIEDIENKPHKELDKKSADFLRGGPYRDLTKFCFLCHDKNEFKRKNIHAQLLESGKVDENTCQYCHKEKPDPENPKAREDLKLRLPIKTICLGCHLKTPHINALVHQSKADDKMRDVIEKAEYEQKIRMPLTDTHEITCITCHTPHEKGVIPEDQPGGKQVAESSIDDGITYSSSNWTSIYAADKAERLAKFTEIHGRPFTLEYKRLDKEMLLRLPAKNGELCDVCHQFED